MNFILDSLQNTQQHQPRTLSLDDIEALSQDLNFMNYNSNTEWGMKWFNTVSIDNGTENDNE